MRNLFLCITFIFTANVFSQIDLISYNKYKKDSILQLNVGEVYPDFFTTSLNCEKFSGKILQNKVTIINFWFQHCEPCIIEFDALNNLYEKFCKNPVFQFISFTSDSEENAIEATMQYSLLFPVCPISRQECYRLNFNQGFPTTIIVDKEGKVNFIKSGGHIDKEKASKDVQLFEQKVKTLLNINSSH